MRIHFYSYRALSSIQEHANPTISNFPSGGPCSYIIRSRKRKSQLMGG